MGIDGNNKPRRDRPPLCVLDNTLLVCVTCVVSLWVQSVVAAVRLEAQFLDVLSHLLHLFSIMWWLEIGRAALFYSQVWSVPWFPSNSGRQCYPLALGVSEIVHIVL